MSYARANVKLIFSFLLLTTERVGLKFLYASRAHTTRATNSAAFLFSVQLIGYLMTFEEWHDMVSYGFWTTADGREVLFNRSYWPILEHHPGAPAKAARPSEWVDGIIRSEYFFDDWSAPWRSPKAPACRASLANCNRVLAEWGVPPLPPMPSERRSSIEMISLADLVREPLWPRVNPWAALAEA